MDGEDITDGDEGYCDYYGGEMTEDGYCCVDKAVEEFKFLEESEHNLKFYCVNGFGTKSDIDEEKFKVSGRMFKIRLNDKWNLISVPFVLQDDSPEEVFEDAESVQTVWEYDGNTGMWSVYREGEDHTNNLEHIEPGLGYWVLSDCENPINLNAEDLRWKCDSDKCEMLIVGGSLYSPGPVTPPSQNLAEGWNLIGVYGADGKHGYYGPNSNDVSLVNGRDPYCELYSLRNLNEEGSTKWSALVGYWEPDNPKAWYEPEKCSGEMDPGAGYWISMDEEGNYRPSTICDDECNDGGWFPFF